MGMREGQAALRSRPQLPMGDSDPVTAGRDSPLSLGVTSQTGKGVPSFQIVMGPRGLVYG